MLSTQRAVFFDRDGTLIRDVGYPSAPHDVQVLPQVVEGLRLLRQTGYLLVIISNQSGIGRGYFSETELQRVHERVVTLFSDEGVTFDGAYFCPHAPEDGCECRKPQPGMLRLAAEELEIDLARSVMIGDKPSDVIAGQRAGCRTVLLGETAPPACTPDAVAPDVLAASQWILHQAYAGKRTRM